MSQSKKDHILRAWRDPAYFAGLTAEERAALPPSPAHEVELGADMLESIGGGNSPSAESSAICTPCPPYHCV
ncbi:mersacidin/lichenicidin family type 2 lantibiotic [Myxococcus stipitatus]|uniref:mersacidin/lichenicidin family type 2 lantibiotic n=1 Tax=Myxococcus stipitatus TaxID=83455 RepID=UPI001F2B5C08|nr:mersacidin/lichenicidin family type 2 lantibiotic [Myxococcus stipitatus]MCE9667130.1 mersacidin/lichenicidin family type 2 lantibiotic [Myxococcus stipitatus]